MTPEDVLKNPDTLPWDLPPVSRRTRHVAVLGLVALIPVFCVSIPFAFALLFCLVEARPKPQGTELLTFVAALGAVVVVVFASLAGILKLRLKARRREPDKECGDSEVYFYNSGFWRQFSGRGSVAFNNGGMTMQATLGPDLLIPVLILLAVNVLSAVVWLLGGTGYFFFGGVVFFMLYYYALRRDRTLSVDAEDISAMDFHGPFVSIRFSKSPVSRLKRVGLYVNKAARAPFFACLNAALPDMLPEDYRLALERAGPPPPPSVEHEGNQGES